MRKKKGKVKKKKKTGARWDVVNEMGTRRLKLNSYQFSYIKPTIPHLVSDGLLSWLPRNYT